MTRTFDSRSHRQSGMSLIELMVAMAIGLMLVLMVTQYLIASRQSYQSSMANGDVQDARRFALNVVRQQLWLTGYSDSWEDFDVTFPAYDGNDSGVPSFDAGQLIASSGEDVWLRYRAPALSHQPLTHCDGTVFTASDDDRGNDGSGDGNDSDANDEGDAMAISRVYLEDRTLRCKVYFADREPHDSLPLLDDVDALRWAFLDADDEWKTGDADWDSVRAIRLSIIVASNAPSGERFTQQFEWGDETKVFDDAKARTLAEITTALRNLPEAAL